MVSIILVVKCIVVGSIECLFFVGIVLILEIGIFKEVNILINED